MTTPTNPIDLPPGLTCGDCAHFARKCSRLISSLTGKETRCDWSPSRFRMKPVAGGAPGDDGNLREYADYVRLLDSLDLDPETVAGRLTQAADTIDELLAVCRELVSALHATEICLISWNKQGSPVNVDGICRQAETVIAKSTNPKGA